MACLLPRARTAALLCATLVLGGLLAFIGQTYQTGADTWQLFASWAALSLLWVLAQRSDLLWTLWVAVAAQALALWTWNWWPFDQFQILIMLAWLVLAAVPAAVAYVPWLRLTQGPEHDDSKQHPAPGRWSHRLAVALALAAWVALAISGMFAHAVDLSTWLMAAVLVAAVLGVSLHGRWRDLPSLALATLAANVLVLSLATRLLVAADPDVNIASFFLLGMLGLACLGSSATWLLRQQKAGISEPAPQQAPSTPRAAPLWLAQAQTRGWLPDAWSPSDDTEPSPLLTALVMLGALVCSVPLLAVLALAVGRPLLTTAAGYVIGALALGAGLLWLRGSRHIFANCMALELWGLGLLLMLLCWVNTHNSSDAVFFLASVCVSIILLSSALLIPALWIGRLMGLALVNVLVLALGSGLLLLGLPDNLTLALLMVEVPMLALAWAGWCWHEPRWLGQRLAPRVAALADGWAVGLLLPVALNNPDLETWIASGFGKHMTSWHWYAISGLGVLWVLAGGWALARRWPDRAGKPLLALAGAALALGAWFSPGVGTVALVAALAAASARWRLLAACGLTVLWLLSCFYYSLAWPLTAKGLGLALLGAVLILGLLALRSRAAPQGTTLWDATGAATGNATRLPRRGVMGVLLLGGVIALGLANTDVWRKEEVIAHGQRILVPLAPVDPRSLMQGDYMQLRFAIPPQIRDKTPLDSNAPPRVVAQIDEHGEAQLLHLAQPGETLDAHEITLPLKWRNGDWVLVTDAYFFPEGQGQAFEQARFGELRALPGGRALLVGLADAQGRAIKVKGGN